jgi:hypothetical protein
VQSATLVSSEQWRTGSWTLCASLRKPRISAVCPLERRGQHVWRDGERIRHLRMNARVHTHPHTARRQAFGNLETFDGANLGNGDHTAGRGGCFPVLQIPCAASRVEGDHVMCAFFFQPYPISRHWPELARFARSFWTVQPLLKELGRASALICSFLTSMTGHRTPSKTCGEGLAVKRP